MNISTSTVQQRRRKPSANLADEEDASQLKLGPEFDINQISHEGNETPLITLNLSETRLLINAALKQRKRDQMGRSGAGAGGSGNTGVSGGPDSEDVKLIHDDSLDGTGGHNEDDDEDDQDLSSSNEVLRKTQEYLSVFARFRNEQTVSAVENLLKSPENQDLHPFEVAQLGSLACDEAEEAKTLIPSLADKRSDEDLQVLLDYLRRFG